MFKLFFLTTALFILSSSHSFGDPSPAKKCKCDEDAIINRETKDAQWNKHIHEACASIQNKEYEKAYNSLDQALKISEDSYIKGLYTCLKAMKDAGEFTAPNKTTTVTPKADVKPKQEVSAPAPEPAKQSEATKEVIVTKEEPKTPPAPVKEPVKTEPAPAPAITPAPSPVPPPTPVAKVEAPVVAKEESKTDDRTRVFNAEELASFQAKGILKVNTLKDYLNKISSKSTSMSDGIAAINNAMKLFYGETYVQVSSVGNSNRPNFPTRTYFERVRALKYDNVEIEWADFEYTSNLRKAPDGNYYGYIRFRQRFKGIKDGKVIYEDVTDKVIAVILKAYDKAIEGEKVENFDVFLGDIEVLQVAKN